MKLLKTLLLALCLPAYCMCGSAAGDGPFEYREIYLPDAHLNDTRQLALNNVDNDWGIWGHHLAVVLPKDCSQTVFAIVKGQRNDEQFCFSSDQLFDYISTYIDDTFGSDDTQRFAILPNDNAMVCQCDRCKDLGNTEKNASPAVFHMIERLAKRFPRHLFFTSYYLTTKDAPQRRMPDNTGVLVSAMTYPLSAVATEQEHTFESLLKEWHRHIARVYVWDYINNFDDYFTPYPVFTIMQRRLQLYERAGVKGVFLNGSGQDYSTFSRLKTEVLGRLLQDPHQDWQPLLREQCEKLYPVTGSTIADFIVAQEAWVAEHHKTLPLYEGVAKAVDSYLPADLFLRFHDRLKDLLPQTKDDERKNADLMYRTMIMTRMELMRLAGTIDDGKSMIEQMLPVASSGVKVYSESCNFIEDYMREYGHMLLYAGKLKNNPLRGVTLVPVTPLDEDYSDITMLTDGLIGLPSNYHCGQMLSSADPALKIAIPAVAGLRELSVSLTRNPRYHIALPREVILTAGQSEIGRAVPVPLADTPSRAVVTFRLPAHLADTLLLTIVRNTDERTMAIDEIYGQ